MEPIKYDTWIMFRDWIRSGADVGSDIAAVLFSEIPIIGPLIGEGLVRILGWSLEQLLDYLPHENEPRPTSVNMLPLRPKGYKYYVADPNMYGGDLDAAKAATDKANSEQLPQGPPGELDLISSQLGSDKAPKGVSLGNPAKIKQALELIDLVKKDKKVLDVVPIKPIVTPAQAWNEVVRARVKYPVLAVDIYSGPKGYNPVSAGIVGGKKVNPTWANAGF